MTHIAKSFNLNKNILINNDKKFGNSNLPYNMKQLFLKIKQLFKIYKKVT